MPNIPVITVGGTRYDVKDAITREALGLAATKFTTNGTHSSNDDPIYLDIKSGEEYYVDVQVDDGSAFTGSLVVKSKSDGTVQEAAFTTGTRRKITAAGDSYKFGAYLASSGSHTVSFKIYKAKSAINIGDRLDVLENIVGNRPISAQTTFTLSGGHSSNSDRIDLEVVKDEIFEIDVSLQNGQALSGSCVIKNAAGANVGEFSVTTGTPRRITADVDMASFGVYLPAPSESTKCVFKVRRVEAEEANSIKNITPSADSAIAKMRNVSAFEHGIQFCFITDIHWETNNKTSPKLINYIADNSRISLVINGGDTASGNSDKSKQKEWLYECTSQFNGHYKYYAVNGNHDNNGVGNTDILTPTEIRAFLLPETGDVDYGEGNYYTFAKNGTRFIMLDTKNMGYADATQVAWMKQVIESCSELYIIIVLHIVYVSNSDENPCAFFQNMMTMINGLSAENKNKVQAIFAGHQHNDIVKTFNGIPVVITTTDSRFADDGTARTAGTASAQCFDLVTVNYDSRKIYCHRVGAVKTDRTVSY